VSDINRVVLIGRLTKDPDLRYTKSGSSVCGLSLAVSRTWKEESGKKEKASFFNCVAWARAGEVIAEYCKKGDRISVEGRLDQKTWTAQDGSNRSMVEIVIENFQFLQNKQGGQNQPQRPVSSMAEGQEVSEAPPATFSDDDIPY